VTAGLGRRVVLRLLGVVASGPLLAWWPASTDARLSPADRRLAALGARLAADAPATARRLALSVAREMRGVRRPRVVRRWLLRRERLRRETARGDVVLVDGWVLPRSEAALCAWLHAVRSRTA